MDPKSVKRNRLAEVSDRELFTLRVYAKLLISCRVKQPRIFRNAFPDPNEEV